LHTIRISSHGIREGVLLAYSRHGEQWLEHIQKREPSAPEKKSPYDEEFVQSGRRLLQERAKKMLAWHTDVLKHEDIEAVHKMRVASRRLRAVLDAYESICDPKPFKKIYRRVKDMADILGMARDTDVMIAHLREQREQSADAEKISINWLIKRLEDYRAQHQVELERALHALDEDTWLRQIDACLPEGGFRNGKS